MADMMATLAASFDEIEQKIRLRLRRAA